MSKSIPYQIKTIKDFQDVEGSHQALRSKLIYKLRHNKWVREEAKSNVYGSYPPSLFPKGPTFTQ